MAGSDDDARKTGRDRAREAILARRRVFVASAVATLAFGCDRGRPDVCLNVAVPEDSQDIAPTSPPETPTVDVPSASAAPSSTDAAATETAPSASSSVTPTKPQPPKLKKPAPRICLLMVD